MTEKYILKIKNGVVIIIDKQENILIRDMYRACDILNQLALENVRLKEQIKKLEAQLYCDPDEGVCAICDNEYLVEINNCIDGHYYTPKCKKGHDECSSDVIYHCKDFELKTNGDNDD